MVKIATLSNCSKCNTIKKWLTENNITFTEFNCDEFPDYCDSLEDIINTSNYPIVVQHNPVNVLEIYYVADDYNQLHLDGSLIRGYTLRPKLNLNILKQSIK